MVYEVPNRTRGATEDSHRRDEGADQGRADRDIDVGARVTEVDDW